MPQPDGEAIRQDDPADRPYAFDYTTVGHVTVDVLDDGSRRPGGTAFYSALQAARLGLRTLILTRGVPAEIEALLAPHRDELDVRVLPAARTTMLRTWPDGPHRRQRLLAWAGPIGPVEVDTAILHIAPVARETPRRFFDAHPPSAELVGLTPQGLVRDWSAAGEIALVPLPPQLLPERYDAIVLSATERESCAELLASVPAAGAVVAVTAGAHPTELWLPSGELLHVPARPIATPVDDLGAGDVFAAAFFIALREGQAPARAAAYANAAAAVRVAGVGPDAIGDRAAIASQLGNDGLG
ncbi:MAG TPA: PfkB family carbohydrate kinase [Solirubrobacteraceae bacterium]|jgi:sugar/nucleoside kinase (ribokinase family)|nr:PfkB family carbohydrate kinase [Solirubrobacteraceae bacterium]